MILWAEAKGAHGYNIRLVFDEDVEERPYRLEWKLDPDTSNVGWQTNAQVCYLLVAETWSAFLAKALL